MADVLESGEMPGRTSDIPWVERGDLLLPFVKSKVCRKGDGSETIEGVTGGKVSLDCICVGRLPVILEVVAGRGCTDGGNATLRPGGTTLPSTIVDVACLGEDGAECVKFGNCSDLLIEELVSSSKDILFDKTWTLLIEEEYHNRFFPKKLIK